MRVEFSIQGGIAHFPGLSVPTAWDTAQMPPDRAAELERRVAAARVFAREAVAGPPPGSADHRTYTITVEDQGQRRTITCSDPVQDPDLSALIAYLRALKAG